MEIKAKKFIAIIILALLMIAPAYTVDAQGALDDQFLIAVKELDRDAQKEFLDLLRNPGKLEKDFDNFGVDPELADRIEEKLNIISHNTDFALERLNTVTEVVGAHLERLANQHAGKSRKALQNALARRTAGLNKAKAALSKNVGKAAAKANAPDPAANNGNGAVGGGEGGNGGAGGNGVGGAGGNGAGGNGGNGGNGGGNGNNK